ncbi:hypothetical protein HY227_01830 [Candidatus Wolfebacteria bacterium]|nr:hypothetical protein [Candidatus Wolfebacteria bacterium]
MKFLIFFIVILVVIFGGVIYWAKNSSPKASPEIVAFAQCLGSKNITMYGAVWCPWCKKEKAAFGDAFKFVPYVECPENQAKCKALGVESFPTWIFPDGSASSPQAGKKLVGYQGLSKLSEVSGCSLSGR